MVLAYHGLIEKDPIQISSISYGSKPPAHVSDYGKYVSREYQYGNTTFSTESKEYIPNIGWATGKGAWGYIWTGSVAGVADGLESYLELHDLEVEFIESPTAEQVKAIVIDEIDNNSPLIARTYLTSSGHYAVITGYEIDSNGEISYYVNDPFGKKGCYHKDYGTYTNEIAQPVKYSYSDMGLGESSRGLFNVTSRLPTPTEPSVSTSPATSVDSSSATLGGYLSSMGGASSCTVYFEYGTNKSYGSTTGTQVKSSTGSFSQALTGLSPGTTYHYRAVAFNSAGTIYGADTMFMTSSSATAPVANFIGTPASGIAPLTVQFTDTSMNTPTSWKWEYSAGEIWTQFGFGVMNLSHTFTTPGTYSIRLTVTNAGGSDTETKQDYITVHSAVQQDTQITIIPPTTSLATGQTHDYLVILDTAPAGLSGYNLTVRLTNPAVAEIVGIQFPAWVTLPTNSTIPADSVWCKSADLTGASGKTNITLVTVTLRGDNAGTTNITVLPDRIEDREGGRYTPSITDAILSVIATHPFPNPSGGFFSQPRDLNGNGLYEDLDGNGWIGFNDVVIYYNNLEAIDREDHGPVSFFDYDLNGWAGFNDIVLLYEVIV